MSCIEILTPSSIFSVAGCFDISVFIEYHNLIHIIPLHPLVAYILRLPEPLTVWVQGLNRTYNNKASLVKADTRRWSWFIRDALVILSVLITELHITLGALEGHAAPDTGWVHLAVLEHLSRTNFLPA